MWKWSQSFTEVFKIFLNQMPYVSECHKLLSKPFFVCFSVTYIIYFLSLELDGEIRLGFHIHLFLCSQVSVLETFMLFSSLCCCLFCSLFDMYLMRLLLCNSLTIAKTIFASSQSCKRS